MDRTDSQPADDGEADSLAEVGKYATLAEAHEHGLVILAMREPCLVAETESPGQYVLHAEPTAAPAIARELAAYESEKQSPPPARESEIFRHPAAWLPCAVWVLCLIGVFVWQQQDHTLVRAAASSSTGLIGRGEWWRPITALFLHADLPHLVGNLMSGGIFGTMVARALGPWRAWLWILACGALGNALVAALTWPEEFSSIGASTAVFAALGILTGIGFQAMLKHRRRLPWARIAAPVLAGLVLLGWLGGGSATGNTDVLGHVCGFGCGLATGMLAGVLTSASE